MPGFRFASSARDTSSVLVGAVDRDERGRLARCAGRGVADTARRAVYRARLPDADRRRCFYGHCAVSCLPSFRKAFGLPALEAMACGAAVVGADATSIPEVIGRSDALTSILRMSMRWLRDPTDADR